MAQPPRDEDLFVRAEDLRTVLFGSLDAGRSTFLSVGAKQTLVGPLDRTGFVAMETAGLGLTRERYLGDASRPVLRLTTQTSSLIGFQWALNGLYVALYAGPELEQEQLTVGGRVLRISRPRMGSSAQVEIWANPTTQTLWTETLVLSSTRTSLWNRVSAGYRVAGSLFAGPELTIYATPTYREMRWGAHLTGIEAGRLSLRVSGGWMVQDHARQSPYVGITGWIRL